MFIFYCNCYVYNYLFMVIVPYDSLVNISFFSYLALSLEQLFFWHMVYSGPKRSRMQHFWKTIRPLRDLLWAVVRCRYRIFIIFFFHTPSNIPSLFSLRFLSLDLCDVKWRFPACPYFKFPLPVLMNRFAAAFFVLTPRNGMNNANDGNGVVTILLLGHNTDALANMQLLIKRYVGVMELIKEDDWVETDTTLLEGSDNNDALCANLRWSTTTFSLVLMLLLRSILVANFLNMISEEFLMLVFVDVWCGVALLLPVFWGVRTARRNNTLFCFHLFALLVVVAKEIRRARNRSRKYDEKHNVFHTVSFQLIAAPQPNNYISLFESINIGTY